MQLQLEKGEYVGSETPTSNVALALEGAEPISADAVDKGPKEEQAAQARPSRLLLAAAEWGTSVESLQVQRQCGPEWTQAILKGRPAPECKIIPNSTSGALGQPSGLGTSNGWTGVASADYIIDWYLWVYWRLLLIFGILTICLCLLSSTAVVGYMFWVEFCSVREWMRKQSGQRMSERRRQQGRRTRPANQALQAKEKPRGPAVSQALHADSRGVAAATTVSADASNPSSISSSALGISSAPVSSSLPPPMNPARPPPPPSETAPTPSTPSHSSISPADVTPVLDGTDTTKIRSDDTCEHEIGAANAAMDADASLMVNPLFVPREPSPERQTPSGDGSEVHPLGPMLLGPPAVRQTLMGIELDNSLTNDFHGTAGTVLEGPEIARSDLSVSPAVLAVPVDSQNPMSVAVEDIQTPLECSLDPQAAKSTHSEESLTPVDGPLGDSHTPVDISPDSQAPMIPQSGDLLTLTGGTLSDDEFPMDDCSGAFQSLMAPPAGLPQTPSKGWESANDVSTWSPSRLPDARTAGVKGQLAHLTSWGGENIYLARGAGLVTAKRAGRRTPAEKALGLQMSGDSILAKWGQPSATVKQSSFRKLGKKVVKPLRKAVQPLRNAAKPFKEAMQPLKSTAQQPFKRMAKPLRKVVDAIRR
ncbi:hypothetical protein WJX82_000108 [Trebouxia sp. C0006]